jgi:TonB-linked SusC/RagA family outer membrane protein
MRKIVAFITCMLCLTGLFAQRSISGKVTDENGSPVANVSVLVRETGVGVSTNTEGIFTIRTDDRAKTLVLSYVDMTTQEVSISDRSTINVTMRAADKTMQEVVMVAYGTARKSALTNSVSQFGARELENRPVTNVLSALTGMAPGITTNTTNGQPGSSPAVRIRGFGSVNGSNSPLYVVDGVPYDYDISNINVDDIETVSVLKDAAAASLYGARAANGVIQITTKKGKKDRPLIQFNAAQGFTARGIQEYDRVGPYDYYPLMWEAYRNSLVYPLQATTPALNIDSANKIATGLMPRNPAGLQVYNGRTYSDISQLLGYNPFSVGRTEIVGVNGVLNPNARLLYPDDLDWLKDIQRNGTRSDYTVAVSGGSSKSDHYFSLGYVNEKGYVLNSDYKRYSARMNVNTQATNWLKTGLNLAGIITKANQGANDASGVGGNGLVNPFYSSRVIGPIYPVFAHDVTTGNYILDATGNRIYDIGSMANLGLPNRPSLIGRHAIYETRLNENILQRNVFSGRIYADINFTRNLKFTTNFSGDASTSMRSQFENKIVGDGAPSGRGARNTTNNFTMTFNQLLNYSKTFGEHTIDAMVGHENYDATYRTVTTQRIGQVIEGITELSNFTTTSNLTSAKDRYKIESYLSRLNYGFMNRYFVSGSFRRDGSSRFAPETRWGNFWSVGAGWKIDQESFMEGLTWLNLLKIRSSYGLVGNDDLLDDNNLSIYYAYQSFYDLGNNNNQEAGAAQSTVAGNPELGWEINKQFDIAVEFGLLKSRINGQVEFFDRRSSSLLFRVPPPLSSGTLSLPQNIGTMYNRGIEISLTGEIVRKRDFSWTVTANWTTFRNKVTKLPAKEIPSTASATQKWEVGHSRYDFWLRDFYGVDPIDGAVLFKAKAWVPATTKVLAKGDTVTTDQNNARLHYAGSAIPDFFGAFISSFNFKGFGLSFQLNYQVGGKVYDDTYAQLMNTGNYGYALHTDILKRWQRPGDISDVPRLDAGRNSIFSALSDRWLVDASYLNVQNVTFSYNLPASVAAKAHMQAVRFYVTGENLYMFTRRQGLNPIQNFTGVTSNVYVPSRTITAGLNMTL